MCVPDPDSDILRQLATTREAHEDATWPGHTDLYQFERKDHEYGIVGCAVGASFVVLMTEQLFAAGCQFLVTVTSLGQIVRKDDPRTSCLSTEPSATRGRATRTVREARSHSL